jgi:hypothetical protein
VKETDMARRAKQTQIPGTERPTVPELDEIAGPYVERLYERMELQRDEKSLKLQLLERMKQLKRKVYTFHDGEDEYEFQVESSAKLKTKRKKLGADEPSVEVPDDDDGGDE